MLDVAKKCKAETVAKNLRQKLQNQESYNESFEFSPVLARYIFDKSVDTI